jgi:hypothetical protein
MNWATLYITGRKDFPEEVRRKLEGSKLDFMPGYVDGAAEAGTYDLYWVEENLPLREFKEAIGSKLIWKYRLRFHPTLEDFIQTLDKVATTSNSSEDELDFFTAMRRSA